MLSIEYAVKAHALAARQKGAADAQITAPPTACIAPAAVDALWIPPTPARDG